MYNHYIPQSDGSYRRSSQPDQRRPAPPPKPKPEPKPAPKEEMPPWEEVPPLPEEPPMREEPGERVFDIPAEPVREEIPVRQELPVRQERPAVQAPAAVKREAPAEKKSAGPTVDSGWWRALAETCKGRLSPMYRVFLDLCTGVLEGDTLTVYAQDELALGRLDNDRVRGVLAEEAAKAAGGAVRVLYRVGEPPQGTPEENLKKLLKFGSQFDNVQIK